jgi:hypothetical protein
LDDRSIPASHQQFRFAAQQTDKDQAPNILLHARIEQPSILVGEWRLAEDSHR